MLPALLLTLAQAVIPSLVQKAEEIHPVPGSGADKYNWVTQAVAELFTVVHAKLNLPEWSHGIEDTLAVALKDLIEAEVAKIDPK